MCCADQLNPQPKAANRHSPVSGSKMCGYDMGTRAPLCTGVASFLLSGKSVAGPTPHGLITYASEFRKAALAADDKLGRRSGFELVAPVPVMYLIGHSIELSLKAFLLSQGMSENQLRKLGHDLHKAMRKCRELHFDAALEATAEEVEVLEVLNALYFSKQLNYHESGVKQYPMFGYLESLSKTLLFGAAEQTGYPIGLLV